MEEADAFVLGILARPILSERDLRILQRNLGMEGPLEQHTAMVNKRLDDLGMRLNRLRNELADDEWYYVLENRVPPRDENGEGGSEFPANTLNKADSLQFQQLLALMFNEHNDEEGISSTNIPAKFRSSRILNRLEEDGWIEKLPNTNYCLSLRALIELEPYLEQEYGDLTFKRCLGCRRHLVTGKRCSNLSCQARLHNRCYASYFELQAKPPGPCPECGEGQFK